MIDLIRTFIETYGATLGPLVAIITFVMVWSVFRVDRRHSIRLLRLSMLLIEKGVVDMGDLTSAGVINDSLFGMNGGGLLQ